MPRLAENAHADPGFGTMAAPSIRSVEMARPLTRAARFARSQLPIA